MTFTDVGQGWLIFDIPDAEMGCHPADPEHGAPSGTNHISFYCDDVEKTAAKLKERGVEFTSGVEDHGYGLVTHFKMPGEVTVQRLYQPRYKRNPRPTMAKKATAKPKPKAKAKPRKSKAVVKKKRR